MIDRVQVCGFEVSTGSFKDHINWISERIEANTGAWIVTLNTEMLARANSSPNYRALLVTADLFVADGMPIVWAVNRKNPKTKISERTTGVDLLHYHLSEREPLKFAVIGGNDPISTLQKYPNAEVSCKFLFAGFVDLSESQTANFVNEIQASGAQIVYLALGVPKQDELAATLIEKLPHLIVIGIGGSFEILSGEQIRAPKWMQNSGLEWLFRLTKEPKRLWRRYILNYPAGVYMLLADYVRSFRN